MTDLKVLQQALDNRPNPRDFPVSDFPAIGFRHQGVNMTAWKEADDEWCEDFARKFAAYRAEQEKKDKQLLDHLKKFPSDTSFLCPDCGKFIETTPSFKQQVWFKGLKELLEK